MIEIIDFPKRIRYSKINPLEDFYYKCLISLEIIKDSNKKNASNLKNLEAVQVWAFSVNQKEYDKLKLLTTKYVKKQYPNLPHKKIKYVVGLILLDIGPRVDNKIEKGQVHVNRGELYENRNNENN